MSRKILIASTNAGKMRELKDMLDEGVGWRCLADFNNLEEVIEDGVTFAENAAKKALGYAKQTGLWTIADDSGLVVDALDGKPGVKSARFSGEKSKDIERSLHDDKNMNKVLELLEGIKGQQRTARFVCCLCLASPEKILIETKGVLEGLIANEKMGKGGFGYDPIFWVPDLQKTVAQLSPEEKNSISHRGQAIRKLKPLLTELLQGSIKHGKSPDNYS